jgi:hypothetical protein
MYTKVVIIFSLLTLNCSNVYIVPYKECVNIQQLVIKDESGKVIYEGPGSTLTCPYPNQLFKAGVD